MLKELRKVTKNFEAVQAEKVKLLEEVGVLKSKVSCLTGTVEIQ